MDDIYLVLENKKSKDTTFMVMNSMNHPGTLYVGLMSQETIDNLSGLSAKFFLSPQEVRQLRDVLSKALGDV
jgi:hypothetical protein